VELAKNLGSKAIFINNDEALGSTEIASKKEELNNTIILQTKDWKEIYEFLKLENRTASVVRKTNETDINITVNLDGTGKSKIETGIAFFDHMLDQIARHGQMDLEITVKGDLEVDEHHTIEDTAIALGEVFAKALGNKLGIERYGFCLPMDDCLAQTAIDFGGRNWLVWEAKFKREMIGQMPTEMFFHFFKSFTDGAKANLNIKAEGENEHHKIEAIFKAFAKAIKMAVKRDAEKMILPSTKGVL
jgi:imidazoleglycerol-phosphate dehydratase/histidinol-phosphatase